MILSKDILILSTDKVGGKSPNDFLPGKKSQTVDEVVSVYWYLENLRKWSQPFESYWIKESADQSCSELFTGQSLIPVLRESAALRQRRPTAHGLCSGRASRQCREGVLYLSWCFRNCICCTIASSCHPGTEKPRSPLSPEATDTWSKPGRGHPDGEGLKQCSLSRGFIQA